MAFGARQRFLDAAAPAAEHDPTPDHFKVLADLAQTLATGGGKKLLDDLLKASRDARGAAEVAQREQAAVRKAHEELDLERDRHRQQLDKERNDHDRRIAEREVEMAAREKRTKELQAQAERDLKAAADLKAKWERKFKAFDAA
jgi:hypothetical protein